MATSLNRKEHRLTSQFRWLFYGCFIPVGLFLFYTLPCVERTEVKVMDIKYNDGVQHHDDGATYTTLNLSSSTIPIFSLTAVLPSTRSSISGLEEALNSLLGPSQLREIILLCPDTNVLQARNVIRRVVSSNPHCPDIRLQTFSRDSNPHTRTLHAASQLSRWVLILHEDGLAGQTNYTRQHLLNPPAHSFPYGPNGVCFSSFDSFEPCIRRSIGFPQEAHYLLPPFVMPATLATHREKIFPTAEPWRSLGEHVAASRTDGVGGVVFGTNDNIISRIQNFERAPFRSDNRMLNRESTGLANLGYSDIGTFVIILPTIEDLSQLSSLLCALQGHRGHILNIWVSRNSQDGKLLASDTCTLLYAHLSPWPSQIPERQLSSWLEAIAPRAHVVINLYEDYGFTRTLQPMIDSYFDGISIRLSRRDLAHTEWMSSLTLTEWKNWNQPRIDISIITHNRPYSLVRLLSSLSNAYFFGDRVNLRLNVEQSADQETLKIIQNLVWPYGPVFIHHRIVHGGLMPAVVESWYPGSNDTYGLLLEDDIELSPMFYAWAKMSLLRYRYGHTRNKSPYMFGISLYQQMNVELPPEGRRPFNARSLFSRYGLSSPTTPYLSPIPCSWGAIYFPEHWREFHAFLPTRLSSQCSLNTSHLQLSTSTIVPNVRSNKWTKSWKKYFIELVYLRGYVMLYPNYQDFVSLSTNHLEVGSHVKVRTQEKQKQFVVPLMESTNCGAVGLLDLPGRTLPDLDALPVLNLTGEMATIESLAEAGRLRREELTRCRDNPAPFNVHHFICTC